MRALFILFLSSFAYGQGIPNEWLGSYGGTMEIYNQKGLQQTIGVNFDLNIMDRHNYWTYNMSYVDLKNNDVVSTKSYKILYNEDSKTLWMDEGDSLLIEMSFLGNCLYDHFELREMFFNSSLCQQEKNLLFEITGGQSKPTYTSPLIEEAEGTVQTMRIDFLQRVLLKPKQ
jgi:hypothetical protein